MRNVTFHIHVQRGRGDWASNPDMRRQAGGEGDAPAIPCASGSRHPLPPPPHCKLPTPTCIRQDGGGGGAAPPYTAIHCQNLGLRLLLTNATSKPKAHSNFLYVLRQSLLTACSF